MHSKYSRLHAAAFVSAIAFGALPAGCASQAEPPSRSVANAWQANTRPETPASARSPNDARAPIAPRSTTSRTNDLTDKGPIDLDIIAVVDGSPIPRDRLVELLLRSHGAGVLDQLIGLEAARHAAEQKGLSITESDVDFEFDLALRRLLDPMSPVTSGEFDRAAAQRVLDLMLAQRNMSKEELFVTLRRNAYLRKLVARNLDFTKQQLRSEFDRTYGERVEVRHIQLRNAGDATRIRARLAAGEDSGELASKYSENVASAERGGLLDPFSLGDERVPEPFRRAARALSPGQVSRVVRVGEWYHFIKQERVLPTRSAEFDEVRKDLEQQLTERLSEERMRELYDELFRKSSILIHDPKLRTQFEQRRDKRKP